jgi:hypothetical protein
MKEVARQVHPCTSLVLRAGSSESVVGAGRPTVLGQQQIRTALTLPTGLRLWPMFYLAEKGLGE